MNDIAVTSSETNDAPWAVNPVSEAWSYWVDALQRGILFLDVMRQRSERYEEHAAKLAPHVLRFGPELILDGRQLPRPVNYVLARITPPHGVEIDENKRPFVIVDPRAGHGPGIGGFKAQSEIGVAFQAGHPCYFIGFLPEPVPGQTIEDIAQAEVAFLERVIALHPKADGKPAVVGNCQAGWAVMMVAAKRPELFGPLIVAGSPLSYWAGVRGQNPMRYTGGVLGGSWLTALMGDLGNGKFDGAWLVSNFESLNPANTYWTKQYNLYSKVDTEAPRYLEFEQWWGGHTLLNAHEMQSIARGSRSVQESRRRCKARNPILAKPRLRLRLSPKADPEEMPLIQAMARKPRTSPSAAMLALAIVAHLNSGRRLAAEAVEPMSAAAVVVAAAGGVPISASRKTSSH